jgi:hypothetical protein
LNSLLRRLRTESFCAARPGINSANGIDMIKQKPESARTG